MSSCRQHYALLTVETVGVTPELPGYTSISRAPGSFRQECPLAEWMSEGSRTVEPMNHPDLARTPSSM